MYHVLSVGLGGFIGAVLRYWIGMIPLKSANGFPLTTFGINVIGCIFIGTITAFVAKHDAFPPWLLLFLKVGVCGGFTTFSTFALETSDLIKSGHFLLALLYILGSVGVGVGVIFAVERFAAN